MQDLVCATANPEQRQRLLGDIEQLVDRGLFLQAHTAAAPLGDYGGWQGAEELALASRMVGHLGAARRADALACLAYRRQPQAVQSRLRRARYLLSRRGHYRAWQFCQSLAGWVIEDLAQRAEWLAFQAYVHALLRDFERSAELLAQMDALAQDDPWLEMERSYCLEQEDRYADALAVCQALLARLPDYRAAQQQAARLELQLGREDEALQRLRSAASRLEHGGLCAQLAELLIERGELDEAERWLARVEDCSPLMDASLRSWLAARRCDISCLRNDCGAARTQALAVGWPFYTALAERLETAQGERRVLPVSFVRQHHMTCVPATLTALAAYWQRPVAHLELAEEICYDGTPFHAERAWAERNGWWVAEFRVDWPIARALIDRGLPFTLTLQYTGSGHLQAVVGYDEPRGTLLIRDPAQPHFGECAALGLIESQASSGPRGMLLLPPEELHRLDGLELPERELWDLYYQLNSALEAHHRDQACAAVEQLQALAPGHRLSLQAQRALAWYDGRSNEYLEVTERLLELYPQDANLILAKAGMLAQLQSREVQLQWLAQHGGQADSDPGVAVRYAGLLAEDGRQAELAREVLRRVLRQAPAQAEAWNALASLRWGEGLREEACTLYRIAACLNGFHEGYASQCFRALRCLGRTEEGLHFLEQRRQRQGHLAAGPNLTLIEHLEELERTSEAEQALRQALARRPQDAELLLFAADFFGRLGETARSAEHLARAESLSKRSQWLRAAVLHAQRNGDEPGTSLAWSREAAECEPLNLSAQRLHVQLLRQVEGEAAVDAYVAALRERFPCHGGIGELAVERAQRQSLAAAEQALWQLLEGQPQQAWGRRELAICLARQGRLEQALEQARLVCSIDPDSSNTWSTLAFVLLQDGQREAARDAAREALRRSVDNDYPISFLIDGSASREEALASLALIHAELVQQVTFGDGWMNYQRVACGLLEDATLLEQLEEALNVRPDLWQLWSTVARQHARMHNIEQARHLLQAARERYPLLPRLYLEQAELQRSQGQLEESLATLEQSFRINPLWTASVRLYVDVLLEQGNALERAEQILRRVLARTPDNLELRSYLAYVLGEQAQFVEAAAQAEQVLLEEPADGWAWNQLGRYCAQLQQPQRPRELAQELVRRRGGDADAWMALADIEEASEDREKALRNVLRVAPRHRRANEQLAELLLGEQRFEELHALLAAPCWAGVLPAELALFQARALRAQGELDTAVAHGRELLARHPDFHEGWRELGDWLEQKEDFPGYVEAARQLVRIEPRKPVSLGYLGHALHLNGQLEEALPLYQQAYELDAHYLFAGLSAYDLALQLERREGLRELLERLLTVSSRPDVLLRGLRLARTQDDGELQRRVMRLLCSEAQAEDCWKETLELLDHTGRDSLLQQLLEEGALAGNLHWRAAQHWLVQEETRWGFGNLMRAFRRALPADTQHSCKRALLDLLAGRENCNRQLQECLNASRSAIAEDPQTWAMASYTLLSHKRYEQMFAWLGDWSQRPDLPSWGLDNLAVALRHRGRDTEAADVSRRSLEREPGNVDAMLWLAGDAADSGDPVRVREWLARLPAEPALRPFFAALQAVLEAYCLAVESGDPRRALIGFERGKLLATQQGNQACLRLLERLRRRVAFSAGRARWKAVLVYLRLRF